jgi:hypothetical protein
MNIKTFFSSLTCLLVCCAAAVSLTATAGEVKTNAVVKKGVASTNAAALPIEIPASKFSIPTSAAEGRDPFFPGSTAFRPQVASNGQSAAPVSLNLQGVSPKFCLINGKTIGLDEEYEVPTAGGKVRVHVVTINEDSVVVEVNGSRQVLRLKPGR